MAKFTIPPSHAVAAADDIHPADRLHFVSASGTPWPLRMRKLQTLALCRAMEGAGGFLDKWIDRVRNCANLIETYNWVDQEYVYKSVHRGFRCSYCLCPLCALFQSRKRQFELYATYQVHKKLHEHDVPVLLTPTFPNVRPEDMKPAVSQLLIGLRRLTRTKPWEKAVRGWYRTIEAVNRPERGDINLHAHLFLLLKPEYFQADADIYLDHPTWLKIWRRSMQMDDIKVIHINRIRSRDPGHHADPAEAGIAEVTKYLVKGSGLYSRTSHGWKTDPLIVKALHQGFFNRRLRAMGGTLKQYAKDIDFSQMERSSTAQKTGEEAHLWTEFPAEPDPGDYLLQDDPQEAFHPTGN